MKCDVRLTHNYRFGGNVLKDKCGIFIFLLVALLSHSNTCYYARVTRRYSAGENVHLSSDRAPDDGLLRHGGVNKSHVGSMSHSTFNSVALLTGTGMTNQHVPTFLTSIVSVLLVPEESLPRVICTPNSSIMEFL